MSIIQAEIYDAFIAAKVPEDKARAAAEVIAQKPQSDELATKEYIEKRIAEVEARIAELKGRMDSKMAELKVEMAELKVEMAELKVEIARLGAHQFRNMIISIGINLTAISIATGVIIAVIN